MEKTVLIWDIETTNLEANFGNVLCLGYKYLGEKSTHLISIRDFPRFKKDRTDDIQILCKARDILEAAPVWFTWYGSRFDVPFINSRLIFHGERPLAPRSFMQHIDGWYTSRYKMHLHSNRLASVQSFLGLPTAKTPVTGQQWARARAGYSDGLRYVEHHCRKDVECSEQAYVKIRPLVSKHPNLAVILERPLACPACGANGTVAMNGHRYTQTYRYTEYKCKACHSWSRGPNEKLDFKPILRAS